MNTSTVARDRVARRPLGLLLWVSGMMGALAMTLVVLPRLLKDEVLPLPLWAIVGASLAQTSTLLALAAWAGSALAHKVGLHAPFFESVVAAEPLAPSLRSQLGPGLLAGLAAGVLLAAASLTAPASVTAAMARFDLPLWGRVLYGGVTEELLLRWGFMTVMVWLLWRFIQRGQGSPSARHVWMAIGLSALLFGVGHLPAAAALIEPLTGQVVAFVVCANAVFGVLFGYLYWQYGLEAAMIAHGFGHVVGYATSRLAATMILLARF